MERKVLTEGFKNIANPLYALICTGDDWIIEWASEGYCTLLKIGPDDITGESYLHRLKKRDLELYDGSLTDTKENETFAVRFHNYFMGISWCWVHEPSKTRGVIIAKMPMDNMLRGTNLLCMELDICMDSIHDGIWIIDRNGITLRINKAMERIGGFAADEVVGRHVSHAVERGYTETTVTLKALEAGHPVTMFDYYQNQKKCLNTSTPIFDETGAPWRVIACIRDISELEALHHKLTQVEWEARTYRQKLHSLEVSSQEDLVGFSLTMQNLTRELTKAAHMNHTALILGETGTGKTHAAATIHNKGPRYEAPFLSVNCGAIPMELLEAELFGYEKGAFTGAKESGKPGMFDLAEKGTLFLDEVGELPVPMQVKLLHVLDGDGYRRIGGTKQIIPDVRILAATNRNLKDLLDEGVFRHDLYYRLRGLVIEIPPLRERPDDIVLLARHFLEKAQAKYNVQKTLSPRVIDSLRANPWPGNIRELKTAIDLLVAVTEGPTIEVSDLPLYLRPDGAEEEPKKATDSSLKEAVEALERRMIRDALVKGGSSYKAARILKVSQSTVTRKAQRYKIGIAEIDHK